MSEMDEWVAEAIDLIEWANGDPATNKWAKMRADQGHPKPFNLKYLGIGNEEKISPEFIERFKYIYERVTKAQLAGNLPTNWACLSSTSTTMSRTTSS